MAMKPKKMRGGGMIKKMRGGGMAAPSGKELNCTTKLAALPSMGGPLQEQKERLRGDLGLILQKQLWVKKQTLLKKLEHVVLAAGCLLA